MIGGIKNAASCKNCIGIVDECLAGSIADVRNEIFFKVVQLQQEDVVQALGRHRRRHKLGICAPQRDAGLGNILPDDWISVRSMPDEPSHVVIEAAALRCFVQEFAVDDEAHIDPTYPPAFPLFVLEPLVQVGKRAVIEISSGDANAIDIAARLVESTVGQRTTQVDAKEIPLEDCREIPGHRLKKLREILGNIHDPP